MRLTSFNWRRLNREQFLTESTLDPPTSRSDDAGVPLPDDISMIQRFAAGATHWGLYALLLVQPIVGWMATSAYRAPIMVFGWFELPPICPENRFVSEQLFAIHGVIGMGIAGLAAAHIGAALYHHFARKDRVLMRMISG